MCKALAGEKVVLVYNALADKEVEEILAILRPVVKRLEIIPIESERAMEEGKLCRAADALGMEVRSFEGIDAKEKYLVFGSFVVAEAFMKRMGLAR